MSPPSFSDLGKSSRDVFGKGYHFGVMKLDVKSRARNGVQLTAGGSSQMDSGKVGGSLETKYKVAEHGITLTEKWNTDNKLNASVEIKDKLMKGLTIGIDTSLSPQTGAKNGKLTTEYRHEHLSLDADVDLNLTSGGSPLINAGAVVGHQGWLVGYQMSFDSGKSALTKNNFAGGYHDGDLVIHANVNDGQVYGGSVYQKVNPKLETAVNLGWASTTNTTNFGIAAKYKLDQDANIRAKINNQSHLGLGYQQRLRDGVTLTLSALIDGKNFNAGGHKVGLALELES